ncbi:MAG: hypothetical protein M3253_02955 [Chloroflexota bacterium]|nr:hypothetical protein [Chloroflexota bacterium]
MELHRLTSTSDFARRTGGLLARHEAHKNLPLGLIHSLQFSHLANPTPNHIYREIGYAPVCDVDVYAW